MYTVTYYKLGRQWFLDLPEYIDTGGDASDLERIGGFQDFLEHIAGDKTTVTLVMDVHPFEGADYFELTQSSGGKTGGYYHLHSFNGQPVDLEVWFNEVVYRGQQELPQRIWFKAAPSPRLQEQNENRQAGENAY